MSAAPPSLAGGGAGVLHAPARQVPEPQDVHAMPAPPHAALSSPPWHAPVESQQPLQDDGPHAAVVASVEEPPSSPVGESLPPSPASPASSPGGFVVALASSSGTPLPCPCSVLPPELPEPPLLLPPPSVPPDEDAAAPPPELLFGETPPEGFADEVEHAAQVRSARRARRRSNIAFALATKVFSPGAKVCHPGPVPRLGRSLPRLSPSFMTCTACNQYVARDRGDGVVHARTERHEGNLLLDGRPGRGHARLR
jgi:hypothetical protein